MEGERLRRFREGIYSAAITEDCPPSAWREPLRRFRLWQLAYFFSYKNLVKPMICLTRKGGLMDLPKRKRPARWSVQDTGNRTNILFVTVCAAKRKPIFDREAIHQWLVKCWESSDQWIVGRYILMPDHIHLFCSPMRLDSLPVKNWIAYWKSLSSRQWPYPMDQPVWQMDAWDRQLRNGESYSAKWKYVLENPVRAGLVKKAEDWPYQGEIHVLHWHD